MTDRHPRSNRRPCGRIVSAAVSVLALGLFAEAPALAAPFERLSVKPTGGELSGTSVYPALSGDGRYVAFISGAPGITADDNDTLDDVFVRDRELGKTVLVSKSSAGVKGNRNSGDKSSYGVGGPAISADGRFVAFTSLATNLIDDGPVSGIYVHDRDADGDGVFDEPGGVKTVLVSRDSSGAPVAGFGVQFPDISDDGRFVAFASIPPLVPEDTNGERDVYVYDRDSDGNGTFDEPGGVSIERASVGQGGVQGNGESGRPDLQISGDGRILAFVSYADNLVPFDTNEVADIFVRDRVAQTTERINVSSTGKQSIPIYDSYEFGLSGNGRIVAFLTQDTSLADGEPGYGGVAPEESEILIRDRWTGRTTLWAAGSPAARQVRSTSYRPALSYDGNMMAFYTRFGEAFGRDGVSTPKNHVEIYVHDRLSKRTVTRSIDAEDSNRTTVLARGISISNDGRVVAFDTEGVVLGPDNNASRDVFAESCPIARQDDPTFAFCEPHSFAELSPANQSRFETGVDGFRFVDTVADGLGPVFNGASCAECHNRPWVGGTSDRTVTRIGASGPGGFDLLVNAGGPTIQAFGISTPGCSLPGETIPGAASIVTERDVPALFGAGLIDLIPDDMILRLADPDDRNHDGISGRPNMIGGRVGRFGRKAQIASLREFASDAYLEEMGITSPDRPQEIAPQGGPILCDTVPDPEDDGSAVQRFVDFINYLAPLPAEQYLDKIVKRDARNGRKAFNRIGCAGCHVEKIRMPSALLAPFGVRRASLFSDLLLHDLGPAVADGVEQGEASGNEFRTSPLWGVGWTAPYMHDGRAETLDAAILAHGGEAQAARDAFAAMNAVDRAELIAFLRSL